MHNMIIEDERNIDDANDIEYQQIDKRLRVQIFYDEFSVLRKMKKKKRIWNNKKRCIGYSRENVTPRRWDRWTWKWCWPNHVSHITWNRNKLHIKTTFFSDRVSLIICKNKSAFNSGHKHYFVVVNPLSF
jgi:hypothetical protein